MQGAKAIPMTASEQGFYEELKRKNKLAYLEHIRIQILLLCHSGLNNSEVSRELKVSLNMVKKWRSRWLSGYDNHRQLEGQKKHFYLTNFLKDNPRSGSPKKISAAQEQSIVALACGKPRDYGIEMTDWTLAMLSKVAASKGIVKSISTSQLSRLLKKTSPPTS